VNSATNGFGLKSRLLVIWQLRTSLIWIGEWNRVSQAESDKAARQLIDKRCATFGSVIAFWSNALAIPLRRV